MVPRDPGVDIDFGEGFADVVQAAGTLQVGIDHQDPRAAVRQVLEDLADDLAEVVPVLGLFRAAAEIRAGRFGRGRGQQRLHRRRAPLLLEVGDGQIHRDDVVPLGGALDPGDADGHLALVDQGRRPGAGQGAADAAIQGGQVFPAAAVDPETVALEGLLHREALHVGAGVPGDGHVVVVDEHLDVEALGHGVARGLGIAALLLGAVAAEHDHDLVRVGRGHAVDVAPQVAQAPGAEKNALGVIALGMPVKTAAELAVVQERLGRLVAV